ncbi:MAG TPA: hypothetical protein VHO28_11160 [Ignavibacteriales bacterium]|nr:hypothetical protein [Ignavibacteriales bacterium]
MKRTFCKFFIIISSFTLSACASVYVPNAVNVPMLDKAGDVQLGAHTGINGFDLQASAAITDNFAVMLNGAFLSETGDTNNYRKRKFGEIGLGYFTSFREMGRFEVYAGYGVGKTSAMDDFEIPGVWTNYAEGSYSRIFVQPSIGMESKVVDFGLAMRVAYVQIYSLKNKVDDINFEENSTYYEPVVFVRVGAPPVKLSFQWGFSRSSSKDMLFLDPNSTIMSFGIVVNLFQ